jgi:hypothetical protein
VSSGTGSKISKCSSSSGSTSVNSSGSRGSSGSGAINTDLQSVLVPHVRGVEGSKVVFVVNGKEFKRNAFDPLFDKKAWFNDEMIDVQLSDLSLEVEPVTRIGFMNSNVLELVLGKGGKATKYFKKNDIFSFDLFFMPINVDKIHWVLLTFFPHTKQIQYFDSFGKECSSATKHKILLIINIFAHFIEVKGNETKSQWTVQMANDEKLQHDGYECGAWVCLAAENYASTGSIVPLTRDSCIGYRHKMLHNLIAKYFVPESIEVDEGEGDDIIIQDAARSVERGFQYYPTVPIVVSDVEYVRYSAI